MRLGFHAAVISTAITTLTTDSLAVTLLMGATALGLVVKGVRP